MNKRTWAVVLAAGLLATPVFGQGVVVQREKQVVADKLDAAKVMVDKLTVELDQRSKMGVIGHVIKGAPYSAETISESVQALPDGNRISRRTVSRVFRDSEGRTRSEQLQTNSGSMIGSSSNQVVSISDPVSGATYMLYPATRTAYANNAVIVAFKMGAAEGVRGELKAIEEKVATETAHARGTTFTYSVSSPWVTLPDGFQSVGSLAKNATREELGEQVIEGVAATGTRTTTIIPVGAIGNEQPIRIVSEEWMCKDLGILVLTRYSDPRMGETTYRVTNINRAEPDPALFQVPPDYKMQESRIRRDSSR